MVEAQISYPRHTPIAMGEPSYNVTGTNYCPG